MRPLSVSVPLLMVALFTIFRLWGNAKVAFGASAKRILRTRSGSKQDAALAAVLRLERARLYCVALAIPLCGPFVAASLLGAGDPVVFMLLALPAATGIAAIVMSFLIGLKGGFPRESFPHDP